MMKANRINWQALSSPAFERETKPEERCAFEPQYTDKAGAAAIQELKRIAGIKDPK